MKNIHSVAVRQKINEFNSNVSKKNAKYDCICVHDKSEKKSLEKTK